MYKFIIDTDQYAGNFEREMCAYLTGKVGECGVGDDFAEISSKEEGDGLFDEVIEVDNEGCSCDIEPNPAWFNTGMGNCYRKNSFSKEEVLKDYAKSVKSYFGPIIKKYEDIKDRILKGETVLNWTAESCDREINCRIKEIQDAENKKDYNECLAYNSVAIFFSSRPTERQIEIMKRRAYNFAEARSEIEKNYGWGNFQLTIEGFRLIRETVSKKFENL